MRTEQRHDDRRRCILRLWWMPLLQLTLLVSWSTNAKVCDAAAIDQQAATESEFVEQENAVATAGDETQAEAAAGDETKAVAAAADETDGQAESQVDQEGENQGKEKPETAATEKPESSDEEEPKEEEPKDDDSKAADEEKEAEDESQQSNESTEEDEAKKMKSDESSSGDASADVEAEDASADVEAENASADIEAGDASTDIEAGDASTDIEAGDASADVENEPAIEVDPPEADAAIEVKKLDPPVQPKTTETKEKCVIGATATLLEKQSELLFRARVDSGAKSCSMHVEKMKIENEAEKMVDNIGKIVQFQVKNNKDKAHWLAGKIAGYVIIKTSQSKERRYKVPLTFRWKHMEKEVLVTLSDRNHMEYPLLLGRNFLRGDFLVDVELDSDD